MLVLFRLQEVRLSDSLTRSRITHWAGPKTLAMLSCALALLATQPWQMPVRAEAAQATAVAASPAQAALAQSRAEVVQGRLTVTASAVMARRASEEVQAHLTWSLLCQMFLDQLHPTPQPVVLDGLQVASLEPYTLAPAPLPPAGLMGLVRADAAAPPERLFAIQHLLLAPPR